MSQSQRPHEDQSMMKLMTALKDAANGAGVDDWENIVHQLAQTNMPSSEDDGDSPSEINVGQSEKSSLQWLRANLSRMH